MPLLKPLLRNSYVLPLFALALILMAGAASASEPLADEFMPLSEIRPGMKGEAFSVVHGQKPVSYEVEILGVETGGLPGSSMILCKVNGPSLEQHGIVAGMSGSPVYIDGKLIGAIAYGWSFAYHPLGGITPIESMLPVLEHIEDPGPADDMRGRGIFGPGGGPLNPAAAAPASTGWDWQRDLEEYLSGSPGKRSPEPVVIRPQSPRVRELIGNRESIQMEPLMSPFTISGATENTVQELKTFMEARGLTLMAAGSNAGSNEEPDEPSPPIVGGSSLAMPLMTGDVSISSVGTVTYRKGDKLIAYGHPAMARGATNLPMSQAYMFGYMQSYDRSFKLGESREVLGTIRQDRTFGVGGLFGEAPPRVDIRVNVSGDGVVNPREFEFSVWEDADFLPMLTGFVAIPESIVGATSAADRVTATAHYKIELADGRIIEKEQNASSQVGIRQIFSLALVRDLFLLLSNPYRQADIKSVDVDVQIEQGFRVDNLITARPRYTEIENGDPLEMDLRWLPYRESEYTQRISIPLPEDLEPGQYIVHIADAQASQVISQRHNPGRFSPLDFDQTVELAQSLNYPQSQMQVFVFKPATGLSVRGESFGNLPSSTQMLVAGTAPPQLQHETVGELVSLQEFAYDFPVLANASFVIEVVPWKAG